MLLFSVLIIESGTPTTHHDPIDMAVVVAIWITTVMLFVVKRRAVQVGKGSPQEEQSCE